MTTEDPELLKKQMALIERMRKAKDVLFGMGEEANAIGLPIAARDCDFASKELAKSIDNQLRGMKGNVPEGFR